MAVAQALLLPLYPPDFLVVHPFPPNLSARRLIIISCIQKSHNRALESSSKVILIHSKHLLDSVQFKLCDTITCLVYSTVNFKNIIIELFYCLSILFSIIDQIKLKRNDDNIRVLYEY